MSVCAKVTCDSSDLAHQIIKQQNIKQSVCNIVTNNKHWIK